MARYLFAFILAWLVAGILPGVSGAPLWCAGVPAVVAVTLMLLLRFADTDIKWRLLLSPLRSVGIGLMFLSLGMVAGWLACPLRELPDEGLYPLAFGEVKRCDSLPDGCRVTLRLEGFTDLSGSRHQGAGNTGMQLYLHRAIKAPEVHDRVMFFRNFRDIADDGNVQRPDYVERLRSKGIVYFQYLGYDDELMRLRPCRDADYYLDCVRAWFARCIAGSGVSAETSAFLQTLLIGIADAYTPEQREVLADAGVAHILAVSGLHLGIISGLIYLLTSPIVLFGGRRTRLVAVVVLTWLYVVLCGMHYPALRAALMLTALMTARLAERHSSGWNALCMALTCILLVEPMAVFDVGLQLSAVCVFSLLALAQPLAPEQRRKGRMLTKAVGAMSVSVVIFFGSWPVMAYYFHSLPTMFLPVNLLVVPLLPAYLCVALVHVALSGAGLQWGVLAAALDFCHDSLIDFCRMMSAGSTLNLYVHAATPVIWLAGVALAAVGLRGSRKAAAAGGALLIAAVASVWLLPGDVPADGYILQTSRRDVAIAAYANARELSMSLPTEREDTLNLGGVRTVVTGRETLSRLRAIERGDSVEMPECELLVVTDAYNGPAYLLADGFSPRAVALHTSLYPKRAEYLEEDLRRLGVTTFNMHRHGPLRLLDGQGN